MSDKIAEIRDRHRKRTEIDHNGSYRLDGYSYPGTLAQSQRDLETALAEVERLNKDLATQQGCCDGAAAQDAHVRREREEHKAEVEKLRAALKPFAALSLWPDDIGDEWTVNDIRSGYDWDETENDTKTDDVFIKRGHIRAARNALEGKP